MGHVVSLDLLRQLAYVIVGAEVGQNPTYNVETTTRTNTPPSVRVATPVFDGAKWDEKDQAGKHPTIQEILEWGVLVFLVFLVFLVRA